MRHIDFENIEDKLDATLASEEWQKLVKDMDEASEVYMVANGGLWAIANHAADDATRLCAKAGIKKFFYTMESQCMMTSIANDYGYNNVFLRWLEIAYQTGAMSQDAMVISLSCSGNSKNVVSCAHWAKRNGLRTAQISGVKSQVLPEDINEVVLDTKYFHTTEVMALMLFYDAIHAMGAKCPLIKEEIVRKGSAESLGRNPLD